MSDLYLVHHGIKGQKWGIRRYQNEDGSLTPAGRERYYGNGSLEKALNKQEKAKAHNRAEEIKYREKAYNARSNAKYDKMTKKADEYRALIDEGEKEVNALLQEVERRGLTVSSKEIMTYQRIRPMVAMQLGVGGLLGNAAYAGYNTYKHYKQRDKYNGESQAITYRKKYRLNR